MTRVVVYITTQCGRLTVKRMPPRRVTVRGLDRNRSEWNCDMRSIPAWVVGENAVDHTFVVTVSEFLQSDSGHYVIKTIDDLTEAEAKAVLLHFWAIARAGGQHAVV